MMLFTLQTAKQLLLLPPCTTSISLDLGKTQTSVTIEKKDIVIGNITIPKKQLEKVKEKLVYVSIDGKLKAVSFFSDETNLFYSMKPTKDWPTFLLSSTPMHRYAQISPKEDAQLRMKVLKPISGKILDTCCGFGYCAILASEHGIVDTYERDSNVLRLAQFNPYSAELFSSKNITLHEQDFLEVLPTIPNKTYDVLIHDPPTPKLSPDMYSVECYEQLYRILKRKAKAYFYAPAPQKQAGREYHLEMLRRLKKAGFRECTYDPNSCGILCKK